MLIILDHIRVEGCQTKSRLLGGAAGRQTRLSGGPLCRTYTSKRSFGPQGGVLQVLFSEKVMGSICAQYDDMTIRRQDAITQRLSSKASHLAFKAL